MHFSTKELAVNKIYIYIYQRLRLCRPISKIRMILLMDAQNWNGIFNNHVCNASHMRPGRHFQNVEREPCICIWKYIWNDSLSTCPTSDVNDLWLAMSRYNKKSWLTLLTLSSSLLMWMLNGCPCSARGSTLQPPKGMMPCNQENHSIT